MLVYSHLLYYTFCVHKISLCIGLVVVLLFSHNWSKTTKDNDELGAQLLIVVFYTWGKKSKGDNKLPGLLLSFAPEKKNAKNDNESWSSLSSFATKVK
jgi:hypothetical protein